MADPNPPRWLKPANKVMIALQKLGVPTGPPMVYTVAGYPGADWERNARAAGSGTLSHGRDMRPVTIVELTAGRIAVFRFEPLPTS